MRRSIVALAFVSIPLAVTLTAAQSRSADLTIRTTPAPAARGESPAAFGRRCIPPDCVAPRSNIPDILARRALPAGRIAGLGATPDFHQGLLGWFTLLFLARSARRARYTVAQRGQHSRLGPYNRLNDSTG